MSTAEHRPGHDDAGREVYQLTAYDRRHPAVVLCTFGWAGFLRPAPGTWGNLAAVLLAALVAWLLPGWWFPLTGLGAVAALLAGLLAYPAAARVFGREDPGEVVIDEVAGVWLACSLLPASGVVARPWLVLPALFLAFRLLVKAMFVPIEQG